MTPRRVAFDVPGLPAPQGSKRAYVHPTLKRAIMIEDNKKTKPWRQDVAFFARQAMAGAPPLDGPLVAVLTFHLPRPKSHYLGNDLARMIRPTAPRLVGKKPDADKLYRAAGDAMTGIVYHDDAQLADVHVIKLFAGPGTEPGLRVEIEEAS